jgi:hypothetical protein
LYEGVFGFVAEVAVAVEVGDVLGLQLGADDLQFDGADGIDFAGEVGDDGID